LFDGKSIKLENGVASEEAAPGSASRITTKFFGNEVYADVNKDGKQDAVFYLTQDQGGSGTFYYVAVALAAGDGFKGSEAYFLGDRIAPQPINVDENGVILANFADRKEGESFEVAPSQGKTVRLKLDVSSMRFGIVADIPGEADPAHMTIYLKTWDWQGTQLKDGTKILPRLQGKFKLTFAKENRATIGTDCNAVSGTFAVEFEKLTFSNIISTEMYCENAQEAAFVKQISDVESYAFTARGELKLVLKNNAGTMVFK
jgi:heat shock protein HslJ